MQKIRHIFIVLGILLYSIPASAAQLSISMGFPNANIGIQLSDYPDLVVMPGYPVYYAPRLDANFFFYDGWYWVYQDDDWYASSWYNGPWGLVAREDVPVFVLRIPVRYYRLPPAYFVGWRQDAPPRWGDRWGHEWEQHRSGWNRWNRVESQSPAPLPVYQRNFSGDRYPHQVEQQQELQKQNYRHQPRAQIVQQREQEPGMQKSPVQQGRAQPERQIAPEDRGSRQHRQQDAPAPAEQRSQQPQRNGADAQRPAPASAPQARPEAQDHRQPPQQEQGRREQQAPKSQAREERQQEKDAARESKQKHGQDQERGRDRNE